MVRFKLAGATYGVLKTRDGFVVTRDGAWVLSRVPFKRRSRAYAWIMRDAERTEPKANYRRPEHPTPKRDEDASARIAQAVAELEALLGPPPH